MKTEILYFEEYERRWHDGARFGEPLDELARSYLMSESFGDGALFSEWCLGWVWTQWIKGGECAEITPKVSANLSRGMQMRRDSSVFKKKPLHDMLLMVCACVAADQDDLVAVAECVLDTGGDGRAKPSDTNEIHECAWSGMFKYWVLKDYEKAATEAEAIWSSNAHSSVRGAAAGLVKPWLGRDWDAFRKQQKLDFRRRWTWLKKNRAMAERKTKRIIELRRLSLVLERWCWAHCAMAFLAYRDGVEVETDSFWFPPHALKVIDSLK